MKNIEIKARVECLVPLREKLEKLSAEFIGVDVQKDTYYIVEYGRLKLREGNIENNLIHYLRNNKSGPKKSAVTLMKNPKDSCLKEILGNALKVDVTVEKRREIYFIDNVKFHLDEVENLGSFFEIEAIDDNESIPISTLRNQCQKYLNLFEITEDKLISLSYSDLLRHEK